MRSRKVTLKDVRDAALIGQIIGEADMAKAYTPTICLGDGCGHRHVLEENCTAPAIGASRRAVQLWLEASNAIATPLHERDEEIAAAKTKAKKHRIERLYAWVDSLGGGEPHYDELEAAAVIRDGDLPPGWMTR